jgi:predicted transcriptional regulator
VVDGEGRLVGIVRRERGVIEQPELVANADDDVLDVVAQMRMAGVDRCPVIDRATQRVVGFLSPSDILRARMRLSG